MFSFEGWRLLMKLGCPSWRPKESKLQFLIKFSAVFFVFNFWSSKPWIRIHLKCWIRIQIRIHNSGSGNWLLLVSGSQCRIRCGLSTSYRLLAVSALLTPHADRSLGDCSSFFLVLFLYHFIGYRMRYWAPYYFSLFGLPGQFCINWLYAAIDSLSLYWVKFMISV